MSVVGEEPGGVLGAAERRAGRLGAGGYAFALCLAVLAAVGGVALLVEQPYLFPSLGPTVMLFFESPRQKSAAPRSTLIGHGVAILAGAGCLALFGLTEHPPVIQEGVTGARVGAAALSVALTALVLRLLDCPHPPAGATNLIVSLGLLTSTRELLAIAAGVLLVTVLGVALNRLLGVGQPLWR
ncbi:HPP family protein [Saccharothrix saharensis]|uniref:HPP family protein n=1 Tax=Saccharothrix saharensis TaxID=571190 RepID=A0A543J968_9PSEU|nr:HPP family protein [Saccharothrix saharensis]TQM79361.1 HPP family protein [Saccharothrix saharensis]